MHRSLRLLLIALLSLSLVGVPAQAQAPGPGAGLGIRLLEAPASRADDPRARQYVVDHVMPGARFERAIEVTNDRAEGAAVDVYPNAAIVRDGEFLPLARGAQNELTDWISVEPRRLVLAPRTSGRATVSVAVPSDARPGEYYGVVFAELPGPAVTSGASISARTGIRVYLSVGEGDEPASDFVVDAVQAGRSADGRPVVRATVRNTGGRALDMSGELRLSDGPGGLSAGPFSAVLGTSLAPGDEAPVQVRLDKAISGGPWRARIVMRSGTLERLAEAVITFPDQAGAEAAPVSAKNLPLREDPDVVVPVAAGVLVLAALLLLLALLRRRQREEEPAG